LGVLQLSVIGVGMKMQMTISNIAASVFLALIMTGPSAADPISDGPSLKTKPRLNPASPLKPAGEHDPMLSRLLREASCKVKLTVKADGSFDHFSIAQSSGIPEIDQLCLRAFVAGRLLPATENGVPISSTIEIPITWHPRGK
jgi:TonB family protein